VNVLVIGGDSLIGLALAQALEARGHRVTRTTRRTPVADAIALDLATTLPDSLPQCDVAFFCAAMTGFRANRQEPALAERVNVTAPAELARRLVRAGAKAILLSTSAVLDCQSPYMRADRPYAPRGAYGRNKAAAERAFLALGMQAIVLRLTKVLDRSDSLLREWTAALRSGTTVRAFDNHRFSPLAPRHVIDALIAIGEKGAGGIYQVSGRDDWSYAEFAQELARRLGVPPDRVRPCAAAVPPDELTPYTSLDTSRLTELCGFVPPPAGEVLDKALQ
jgi:dTDP-4-dehydrorhamnose reductase